VSFARMDEFLSGTAGSFCLEIFNRPVAEQAVWRALDDSNKWHQRHCALTAPLVVWTIVAMSLFRSLSIVNVFKRVLESTRGTRRLPLNGVVTPEAVYHARARLGWEPLHLLAREVLKTTQDSLFGLKTSAIDGVALDVPDTPFNLVGFGRPISSRGRAAFPQLKGVALVDLGSRQFTDCVWGAWNMSELVAAEMLLDNLGSSDLLFLDRRYTKVDLWFNCLARGIHFVHRLSSSYKPHRGERLGPGDWLIEVGRWVEIPSEERTDRRKRRWESRTLRLIQYRVGDRETVSLITDLLDPVKYPASEIALGYHLRWEIELTYDETKTHLSTVLHGTTHTTFRSQKPRGVLQEAWGLIAAYNLVRGLMVEAGTAHSVPPLEISFVDSLEVIRMALPRLQSCADGKRRSLYLQMIRDIADCRLDRPRRKRWAPRVVKQKIGTFLLKREGDRSIPYDFAAELTLVGSG
jgi:DDE family transposase/transposase IS4-like protein